MKKIILAGILAGLTMTGCSTHTAQQVTFDTTNVDYTKEYKMAEDCRLKIPIVAQISNLINGPHLVNAREVAAKNGISKIAYYEAEDRAFSVCFTVYGE
ncbi:MAG: hypothetical protein OIF32_09975 [Campylobacterales bacterium]|nr:hypothetical protein [Campylobacterales bacterium]